MGAKIDSIRLMHSLSLPAPRCVFVFNNNELDKRLEEYFSASEGERFCIRTDTDGNSLSMPRNLSATKQELVELSRKWLSEGYQIILQEHVDLNHDKIIIEAANGKHHVMVNQQKVDVHLELPRFVSFDTQKLIHFNDKHCLSRSEFLRLVRLARKVPFDEALVEFSFTKDGRLFFWEIKNMKNPKNS